ncbi:MAG TPA: sulfite exporter TauE/SafE family protein [Blastocatellia bacterium]|nr:sulfite exporter TauE/SafE family protein [Blastocatellia bacterium]
MRITSLLYGLGLGFGLATRIPVGTFYVAATWAVLVGNPLLGALCLGVFGLGRALPLLVMSWALRGDQESFQTNQIIRNWEPAMHLINGLALGSVGSCLIVAGMVRYM